MCVNSLYMSGLLNRCSLGAPVSRENNYLLGPLQCAEVEQLQIADKMQQTLSQSPEGVQKSVNIEDPKPV